MGPIALTIAVLAILIAVLGIRVGYLWATRPRARLVTPEKVAEVRKTFTEQMAEALERNPPRERVTGLRPISGHDAPCPRCGSHATTFEFMSGSHHGCPDERMRTVEDPFGVLFEVDYDLLAQNQRIAEAAVEHHDRQCFNCEFRWVEATL